MSGPRQAVVTGCSSGIGAAVARMLLADGWWVIGVSRSAPELVDRRFEWFPDDVSRLDYVMQELAAPSIEIDALIHCAGAQEPVGPLAESDPDAWAASIQTNLIGAYRAVRACLPSLRRSEDGRILLFSGGGAFNPRPNYSAYAVSKAGVVSLMETLAVELRGTAVTANCVAPGFVPTPIHAPTVHAGPSVVGDAEFRLALREDGGEMARVVACVRHLLSPDARGLTGKTVAVGWDPWTEISPATVDFLNGSDIWTRTRVKAQRVPTPVRA